MIALSGSGVFSMKQRKSVVCSIYDSFLVKGSKRESIRLEMRPVGLPFPETIGHGVPA